MEPLRIAIFLHLHDNLSGSAFTSEASVQKNMAEKNNPKNKMENKRKMKMLLAVKEKRYENTKESMSLVHPSLSPSALR